MKRFWDARAKEDPFFFVDNRLAYGDPDLDRFWASGEEALQTILDRMGTTISATDDVVEIGCGLGRMTRALAARGRSVRAVDVSDEMLARARELNAHVRNVQWIRGDGVSLAGIDDASADVCQSHVVFQHIPDPNITLGYVREIGRVLRPSGWATFVVSNEPSVHRRPSLPARALGVARAAIRRGPRGQSHPAWLGSYVDLDDLRAAAADGGAPVDRIDGEGSQYCVVLVRKPVAEVA